MEGEGRERGMEGKGTGRKGEREGIDRNENFLFYALQNTTKKITESVDELSATFFLARCGLTAGHTCRFAEKCEMCLQPVTCSQKDGQVELGKSSETCRLNEAEREENRNKAAVVLELL